jgi:putative FmdB family regulatory protein
MPTYVYKREDGTTFEVMQRITEDPLAECPSTGQKVKRVIGGGAGLIFKGEGFYLTDYARKKSSPATESDGSSNADSSAKGSSESKESSAGSTKSDSSGGSSS